MLSAAGTRGAYKGTHWGKVADVYGSKHSHVRHAKPQNWKERISSMLQGCDLSDTLIDPYVKVALMPWRIIAKTRTFDDYHEGTVVEWDEVLTIRVPSENQTRKKYQLAVQVWDEDVGADDICGKGSVNKDTLDRAFAVPNTQCRVDCELVDKVGEDCGVVSLSVMYVPLATPQKPVVGGKWKAAGGPIKGNLEVHVLRMEGLSNPLKHQDVSQSRELYFYGSLLTMFYFGVGALVFMLGNGDGSWTFIDTVYFGIVTITTTGYGDLLPTSNGAKIYSMLNVYFGVCIISSVLGYIVAGIMEAKATAMVDEIQGKFEDDGNPTKGVVNRISDLVCKSIPIPRHVCMAFLLMLIVKVMGILYYTHADPHSIHDGDGAIVACSGAATEINSNGTASFTGCPDCVNMYNVSEHFDASFMGEPFCDNGHMAYNNNLLTTVYMTSVSMTSVGYGDYSPTGQGARLFAAFWLLIGALLNANAWGSLTSWLLARYQAMLEKKVKTKVFDAKSIMKIDKNEDSVIDEMEFVTHMLVKTNKADLSTLADIRRQFAELDHSGDGIITKEDLEMAELPNRRKTEVIAKMQSMQVLPGIKTPQSGIKTPQSVTRTAVQPFK